MSACPQTPHNPPNPPPTRTHTYPNPKKCVCPVLDKLSLCSKLTFLFFKILQSMLIVTCSAKAVKVVIEYLKIKSRLGTPPQVTPQVGI